MAKKVTPDRTDYICVDGQWAAYRLPAHPRAWLVNAKGQRVKAEQIGDAPQQWYVYRKPAGDESARPRWCPYDKAARAADEPLELVDEQGGWWEAVTPEQVIKEQEKALDEWEQYYDTTAAGRPSKTQHQQEQARLEYRAAMREPGATVEAAVAHACAKSGLSTRYIYKLKARDRDGWSGEPDREVRDGVGDPFAP